MDSKVTGILAAALVSLPAFAQAVEFGGVEFPSGAQSFADSVVTFNLESPTGVDVPYDDPNEALGAPDWNSSAETGAVSLGNADEGQVNELVVRFDDNALVDVEGDDLYIFEVGTEAEATEVAISTDGETWYELGQIEGATRALDLADFPEVPANTEFTFVRLRDFADGNTSGEPYAGPDIDAIGAIGTVITQLPADGLCRRQDATDERYEEVVFPHGVLSFADQLVRFSPGNGVEDEYLDGTNILGPPDEVAAALGTINEDSLDLDGSIVAFFRDNFLTDIPGDDLYIFEIGPQTEATFVDISEDGTEWYELGRVEGSTSTIDLADFEGLPARGIYRFVRLRTDPDQQRSGSPFAGPDIDAIGAISSCDSVALEDTDGDGEPDEIVGGETSSELSDIDGDGVPDIEDRCPLDPGITETSVEEEGLNCSWSGIGQGDLGVEDINVTEGCGCASGGFGSSLPPLMLVMLGLALLRRRRTGDSTS